MKCRSLVAALAVTAWLLSAGGEVSAQQFPTSIRIAVDEAGNGSIIGFAGLAPLPSALLPDPGPGGLAAALTYGLLNPPGLVAGDVIITEPGAPSGTLSDLIRFNPNQNGGSLVFYSDPELPGAPAYFISEQLDLEAFVFRFLLSKNNTALPCKSTGVPLIFAKRRYLLNPLSLISRGRIS